MLLGMNRGFFPTIITRSYSQQPPLKDSITTRLTTQRRSRNMVSLAILGAAVFGIFALSIARVKQDDFSDLDDKGNVKTKRQ
jgi:hypothetical protein